MLALWKDSQTDAAGGPSEDVNEYIDLCPDHLLGFFRRVRKELKLERNDTLFKIWKQFQAANISRKIQQQRKGGETC